MLFKRIFCAFYYLLIIIIIIRRYWRVSYKRVGIAWTSVETTFFPVIFMLRICWKMKILRRIVITCEGEFKLLASLYKYKLNSLYIALLLSTSLYKYKLNSLYIVLLLSTTLYKYKLNSLYIVLLLSTSLYK